VFFRSVPSEELFFGAANSEFFMETEFVDGFESIEENRLVRIVLRQFHDIFLPVRTSRAGRARKFGCKNDELTTFHQSE